MAAPLVSVCVPVYNGEDYLDACLNSIARQSFDDFDVLIVDDGSSDGSVEIARRWVQSDSRFHLHQNASNQGLVGNWNRCIELSQGQWIKFLFQDDLMTPECLREMLDAGAAGNGFVACARVVHYQVPLDPGTPDWYAEHQEFLTLLYPSGGHLSAAVYAAKKLTTIGWNLVGEPSVTLIHRRLFERFGLFDPLLVQLCDSEMWNRLCTNAGVDYVDKKLVSFRVHSKSASTANASRRFRSGVVDELVEMHRLCHAPQLEQFRRNATSAWSLGGLRRKWVKRALLASREARRAARQVPSECAPTRELQGVLDQLPGQAAAMVAWVHRSLTSKSCRA